ncbi:type II secretion system protein [Candidatus Saccharibacteria bacterium]|nr:type II secretion system protein [Candidatus Saccharibacteria bacterium]
MASKNINSKEGFTIIEVVLVLAIAGLIFLMVFIALPALQRSQRDTARRNDMSRVDTSLVQYQTNNSTRNNNLPNPAAGGSFWKGTDDFNDDNACPTSGKSAIACMFVRDYMNSGAAENNKVNEFQDPNGVPYSMFITENWAEKGSISTTATENSKLVRGDVANSWTIGGESPFSEYVVYVVPGARCDGSNVVKSEKRHFAVLYRLEGAGNYCIDDQ